MAGFILQMDRGDCWAEIKQTQLALTGSWLESEWGHLDDAMELWGTISFSLKFYL